MPQSILAGLAYFGCVFAVGFALGVGRTVFLAPRLGETAAVALELPIVLAIAWIACHWSPSTSHAQPIPAACGDGSSRLPCLMAAEGSISLLLAGRGLAEHIELYRELSHLLGLAGQVAFAIVPLLQAWTVDRRPK